MTPTGDVVLEAVGVLALVAFTVAGGTAAHAQGARDAAAVASSASARPTTLRTLYGLAPPARLEAVRTALVLVDFQDEFFHGHLALPDGARAVEQAGRLVAWARASGILVVHVRQVAARAGSLLFAPGTGAVAIVPALAPRPEDLQVTKSIAGAFSRTELDAHLRSRQIDTLIVGGLMTHLAVLTTVSDGAVLGYRVIVAGEAMAARALPAAAAGLETGAPGSFDAASVHRLALAIMADRVADVMRTAAILALPVDVAPAWDREEGRQ